jgi:hypothetical protein
MGEAVRFHHARFRDSDAWPTGGGLNFSEGVALNSRWAVPQLMVAWHVVSLILTVAVALNVAISVALVNAMEPLALATWVLIFSAIAVPIGCLTVAVFAAARRTKTDESLDPIERRSVLVKFRVGLLMRQFIRRLLTSAVVISWAVALAVYGVVNGSGALDGQLRDEFVAPGRLELRSDARVQLGLAMALGGLMIVMLLWLTWARATIRVLEPVSSQGGRRSRSIFVVAHGGEEQFEFRDWVPTSFLLLRWLRVALFALTAVCALGIAALVASFGRHSHVGLVNVATVVVALAFLTGAVVLAVRVVVTNNAARSDPDALGAQPAERPMPWYGQLIMVASALYLTVFGLVAFGSLALVDSTFLGISTPEPTERCSFGINTGGSSSWCNSSAEQRELLADRRRLMLFLSTGSLIAELALITPNATRLTDRSPEHRDDS